MEPQSRDTQRDLARFPRNYHESRTRFLAKGRELKARFNDLEVGECHIPSEKDSGLYMDWLYIPARKNRRRLLTLVSGVHGMEAYTGSAIQQMFLDELLDSVPLDDTGLMVFHAMNPYGFKYHRRGTETNVNLNRNFASNSELFKTQNENYRKLAGLLLPTEPTRGSRLSLLLTAKIIATSMLREKLSIADFVQAVGQGQFEFPNGLEYGGRDLEPVTTHFIDEFGKRLGKYKDLVLFDLHTGLGERSQLHLIPSDRPESLDKDLQQQLLKFDDDKDVYQFTPTNAEGFYTTHGDLNNMLPDLLKKGQRMAAVTVEFGTLGNRSLDKLRTFSRMIAENRGYHYGYISKAAEQECREKFSELFYPSDPKWRSTAILRAHTLLSRVLERMRSN